MKQGKATRRYIETRYRETAKRLAQNIPRETVTLYEASRGRVRITLYSGETHILDRAEVQSILEIAPPYFWKLARIPIVLRYEKTASGVARYVVQGDSWQKRLVEIIVRGDYSPEGLGELTVSQFQKLVARYRSIFFVTISP
ncbi:DUF61 family protein [Aeropyrum camini]|uniref:Uncharacterized protein n=1 Tax=Aeropyrum camini SY1 = JCM 12091 TaxID=1198449 RepID=U3TBC7_9CREN|nr:DUF61 family protein [Aeropyrum camini]BAN90847.1 hypothetical protein ACAM_1378 [Aeropyrum camini SY1 = JCM 12091]